MTRKKRTVTFRGMLANGVHGGILNVEASLAAGKEIGARQKDCYRNAYHALTCAVIPDSSKVWYIEGYATMFDIPLEHGWLVVHGVIIDPTLAVMQDGVYPTQYTPVLAWTARDMMEQASEQMTMPLGDFFVGGWSSGVSLAPEEVGQAWQAAMLKLAGYQGTAQDFYEGKRD